MFYIITTLARLSTSNFAVFVDLENVGAKESMLRYIIEKGSIAIDGISLTVVDVTDTVFRVSVIPHTGAETTLLRQKVGDRVNLECDMIGKYVEKLMGLSQKTETKPALTTAFLAEHGFL